MRCAHFDCYSGAAGDMILAALIDAGLQPTTLHALIDRLSLPGVTLHVSRVQRNGIAAAHVDVQLDPAHQKAHRHLPQILDIIARAGLPATVSACAERIFRRLAEAEAKVHGISIDKVHFHEVGAADAIVDIVGACVGLRELNIERITASPIAAGSGIVRCAHGELPVPAPATAELLRGVPLAACDEAGELTTPTGAAILTTVAHEWGALPPMRISEVGYGAGTRENRSRPNVLRITIGESDAGDETDADLVTVLETQLDDLPPQNVAFAADRLLEAGALDAFLVPIVMKKGRPGQLLTVLCRPGDVARLERVMFRETSTLGIRRHDCARHKLARTHERIETAYGPIRVKLGRQGDAVQQVWPEYEDCAAAAREHNVPLTTIQQAAQEAWQHEHESDTGRT